jgi:hypothetical protein
MATSSAFKKSMQIARAYGALTRAIVAQSNAERIKVAQGNFDTGRRQIDAQAAERSAELSGVFQQHVGQLRSNAAFRGVGQGGSSSALERAAGAQAEVARRNIETNANNAIGALAAQSQIATEDEQLAELQGTFQGLSIGGDFVQALASLPSNTTQTSQWVNTGLGWQQVYTNHETPGSMDLSEMFPELGNLFGEN